jgi:fatty-acyl-CoA synthase
VRNVTQVLRQTYDEHGDDVAIHLMQSRLPDQPITFKDLICGSAGYARALAEAGIRPGEVVIQILQHGPDLIYAFFGAMLHGAIPSILPYLTEKLSPDIYRRSLAALIGVTKPTAIISYDAFEPEISKALRPGDSVRAVLVSSSVTPVRRTQFETMGGLQRAPEDIVLLQHSSGTTGLQKGVALSHHAVFNQLESYSEALAVSGQDVIVSWLPLYHDMGLIAGFIMPILRRMPLVLMSPMEWVRAPAKLMQAITKYRGTLAWLPNFAYNFCAQKIRDRHLEGVDLSSWRAVINCSEPVRHRSHQVFLERFAPYGFREQALATSYAMAENVFAVTQGGILEPLVIDKVDRQAFHEGKVATPSDDPERAFMVVSSGRAIRNCELRILDEKRRDVPERHFGEVALRSDCMLSEYYNRPDVTEKAFVDGWYLTGDIGYLAEGELFVTGRKKDIIIVGGKNIYPQDLESLASEVEGIHAGRVVAFGVYSEDVGSEEVVLVAESDFDNPQQRIDMADEIRLRVTTGSDIALRFVQVVDRNWLIKTSSGKIARGANRDKYLQTYGPLASS